MRKKEKYPQWILESEGSGGLLFRFEVFTKEQAAIDALNAITPRRDANGNRELWAYVRRVNENGSRTWVAERHFNHGWE